MPERDARIRAYLLDRLFVAHGRGERLLRAGLAYLPGPAVASHLADRLLFGRAWVLDPEAPALRPATDAAGASRRAQELWTSAAPLLGTAARVAAGHGGLSESAEELLGRSILVRDYAGHGRRQLVLFPFPPGAGVPSVVVKVCRAGGWQGRAGDEASSLGAEWESLTRLAEELPPELAATVPAPLAYESSDGEEVLVASHAEGRPVYLELQNRLLPRRGASAHLRDAADWLGAFHRATRRPGRRMTLTAEDRAHAARLGDADDGTDGAAAWLAELAAALEAHPVALSAGHGDYWPRNLLRRKGPGGGEGPADSEVPPVGVVDWERFAPAAPPTEDLFDFAIAYGSSVRWRGSGRVGLAEAFRRILFTDHGVARAVGAYLARYAARAGLPPSLLPPLLRLYVLRRHRRAEEPEERAAWAACRGRLAAERSPVLERFG